MNRDLPPYLTERFVAFSRAVTALIELNEARRGDPDVAQFAREPHPSRFARDFCTVHVDAGRGLGKSTLAGQLARPGDIIVAGSELIARDLRRQTTVVVVAGRDLSVTSAPWQMAAQAARPSGEGFARVFIDEPWLLRPDAMDGIYAGGCACLSRAGRRPTFVLLGPGRS